LTPFPKETIVPPQLARPDLRAPHAGRTDSLGHEGESARLNVEGRAGEREFAFESGTQRRFCRDSSGAPFADTGWPMLDGLFALAIEEVCENSVSSIRTHGFRNGEPLAMAAFETGEMWSYVWTRDLSYAIDLGLAGLDVERCMHSLLFKTSDVKPGCSGSGEQILQDTGSGGSYPVSTDRVVWALAARRVLQHLDDASQRAWIRRTLPILRNTIEQDRRLVFDPATGLYRGEQSFLDWREQTYPECCATSVVDIAMSQSLSTNILHLVILQTAAEWCAATGDEVAAQRYTNWADALDLSINARLWDPQAGLYAGYLLNELGQPVRVKRYDLLGQALAILCGVASAERATRILSSYPTGPHGPSVVWPQDSAAPIYHNHAIWPFVTAYWAKAARLAGHPCAMAAGCRSLVRGAALNLSNMENLDWASGTVHGEAHGLCGPVINSRRQLWSVAGFVSMVQDAIFGMETSQRGIRFLPCIPADLQSDLAPVIHLRRVNFRGKRIDVTVERPANANGVALRIQRITLNGVAVGRGFVDADRLSDQNRWHIELTREDDAISPSLSVFENFGNARAVFAPRAPRWRAVGHHGIEHRDGRVTLHYAPCGDREVVFNIIRDGQRVGTGVTDLEWTDPEPITGRARFYAVEAVCPQSGHHSYPSDLRSDTMHLGLDVPQTLDPCVESGPDAIELALQLQCPGRYALRFDYANGCADIKTGITCAVKHVRLIAPDGSSAGSGYAILPHTGGVNVFQLSSPVFFEARTTGGYRVQVLEDDTSRNMSYFEHNQHYTGHEGGGREPTNHARLRRLCPVWLGSLEDRMPRPNGSSLCRP
jgi:hypothetical protein